MNNNEKKNDFILQEYNSARSRISADIEEINKSEIFYLTIIGLIYFSAFQFKISDEYFLQAISLLALVIAIYGGLRYHAHRKVIAIHEKYIKSVIEPYFLGNASVDGLVSFYDAEKKSILKIVRFVLHGTCIVFSAIFAFFVWYNPGYIISITSKGVPS